MARTRVSSAKGAYPVVVEAGALDTLGDIVDSEHLARPRSLVTDATVAPLHGRRAARSLGIEAVEFVGGERNKSWSTVEAVLCRWLDAGLDRGALVAAVGGGVVTDAVGFAAAVFLRGIDWIAAPTTLLGMVDAAIGGKTGINLAEGKNLVGSFWPPRLVVADVTTLATLPERELRAGLAEVVKTAWIGDRGLLGLIPREHTLDYDTLSLASWESLVARSVAVKAEIVAADEREAGRRKALNLGHTLGHALEAATGYQRFLHGEAVAWGLEAAAVLGRRRRLLSSEGEQILRAATRRLGARPPIADLDAETVCTFVAVDKKRDAGGVGWVLPTDNGVVLDQRVETGEVVEVLRELQRQEQ